MSDFIDVFAGDGPINWEHLKRVYSLQGGIAKATEGGTFRDDRFSNNWSDIYSHNLIRGAYHFAWPVLSAEANAQNFLNCLSLNGISDNDILCLDCESYSDERNVKGMTITQIGEWVVKWFKIIWKEYPKNPYLLYTPISYLKGYDNQLIKEEIPIWLPDYSKEMESVPGYQIKLWQFTSTPLDQSNWVKHENLKTLEESEDDEMPSSEEIFAAVWHTDGVNAPEKDEQNPTWTAQRYLVELFRQVAALRKEVSNLKFVVQSAVPEAAPEQNASETNQNTTSIDG